MLYPYTLPESNRPDLMIVLDASHAEAFNRAARAAETTMGFLMQSKGILGILKSHQFYNVGTIDFHNNVVTCAAIEEFGDSRYGSASWWERWRQDGSDSVVCGTLKKK